MASVQQVVGSYGLSAAGGGVLWPQCSRWWGPMASVQQMVEPASSVQQVVGPCVLSASGAGTLCPLQHVVGPCDRVLSTACGGTLCPQCSMWWDPVSSVQHVVGPRVLSTADGGTLCPQCNGKGVGRQDETSQRKR